MWGSLDNYGFEIGPLMKMSEGVFVDVGANLGKFTIRMGNKLRGNGKVFCFEPEEENFKILQKNIQLNCLANVVAIKKGCYSSNKEVVLYLNENNTEHSTVLQNALYTGKKIIIDVVKLDDVLESEKDVKIIKIDTEGADYEVLRGAEKTIKKWHPLIIFEMEDGNILRRAKIFLGKEGYVIRRISDNNYVAFPFGKISDFQERWINRVKEIYSNTKRLKSEFAIEKEI